MANSFQHLKSSARRRKRLFSILFNPCWWLIGPLALAASFSLVTQPHIWSIIFGVPTLGLVFYWAATEFRDEWSGDYERLVIMLNTSVHSVNSQDDLHLSFGSGHAVLKYIFRIDDLCLKINLKTLSSFIQEAQLGAIYTPTDLLEVLLSLKSLFSNQTLDGALKAGKKSLIEDLSNFIATLECLDSSNCKVCLTLLSVNFWNQSIHDNYRRMGYCI